MSEAWMTELAASPWLLPALFALVIADAFVVVLPSETLVVALGSLAASTGSPSLWAVIPVAALGAVIGDSALFWLGRRVGLDRWSWMRRGRIRSALDRTRATVTRRPAVLVFTARYIPFARIAVNLTAGASGLAYRRFLPLSIAAGVGWAFYNVGIGAAFGALLRDQPLLAVGCSVVVAIIVGVTIDAIVSRWSRRRDATGTAPR
ncbi:membrane protein DedA with SNARE-associated domain [Schumannella luteola]|uniref:Membrane protein DedA with SNARE-associated domain n=1 Tax=Schumannella luteola TaxID=472059 RepID=A0A852YEW6_9MICO|nr:membrane protein DedA with SNARE-associated domain [Schumannella luteola]